jgi:hypothetical protein
MSSITITTNSIGDYQQLVTNLQKSILNEIKN